jgi:hypothetical protein
MVMVAVVTPDAAATMRACPGSIWALGEWRLRASLSGLSRHGARGLATTRPSLCAPMWALGGFRTTMVPGRWSGSSKRWRRLALICFFGCEGGDEAGER